MRFRTKQGPRPMRGYTPWRVEEVGKLHHVVKIRIMTDSKVRIDDMLLKVLDILTDHDTQEHFDRGPEYDTDFSNQWPKAPELSDFRSFMKDFYRQCDDICLTLMKALEVGWGLEDVSLVARCVPSATDLRLTHYPTIPVDEMQSGNTSRNASHTDFGPITLLFQDSTGGLEIDDRTNPEPNYFVPLPPTDTMELIVNVRNTLTRWTNGKITGGIYQVTTPEAMKGISGLIMPPRMSMAYLFKAERNVLVGPLPKFVSSTEPAKYPDITALEFPRWRNSIVYNFDKKEYPNGVDGLNGAPKTTPDVKIASSQDVLETALVKTLGRVTDLVNAGNRNSASSGMNAGQLLAVGNTYSKRVIHSGAACYVKVHFGMEVLAGYESPLYVGLFDFMLDKFKIPSALSGDQPRIMCHCIDFKLTLSDLTGYLVGLNREPNGCTESSRCCGCGGRYPRSVPRPLVTSGTISASTRPSCMTAFTPSRFLNASTAYSLHTRLCMRNNFMP